MESSSLHLELRTESSSVEITKHKLAKMKKESERRSSTSSDKTNWSSRLSCSSPPIYKLRTFSSRGAFLVLILNFLVWASHGLPTIGSNYYLSNGKSNPPEFTVVPIFFWIPAVLLFGLLADIRYGRKKMVFFGLLLMWVVTLVDCAGITSFEYLTNLLHNQELFNILSTISATLGSVANAAFLVNSVQLAIDQLADASAEQVSSFIQWYVFSSYFGGWIFRLLVAGPPLYCFQNVALIQSLTRLAQTVLITLALGLSMVCSSWIMAIPIGANPLKLIWKVLRFAAKHKYPVN